MPANRAVSVVLSSVSAAATAVLLVANTVDGAVPLSVLPRFDAVTASTRMLNSGFVEVLFAARRSRVQR